MGLQDLLFSGKLLCPKLFGVFWRFEGSCNISFYWHKSDGVVSPHGRGLGALFDSGKTNSDYPLMFAVLIALAILGIALYYVIVVLERIFADWADRHGE